MEAIARVRQRCPQMKMSVFSIHQNSRFVLQVMQVGVLGYMTKDSTPDVCSGPSMMFMQANVYGLGMM